MNEFSYFEIVLYAVPFDVGSDEVFTMKLKSIYEEVLSVKRILRFPDREPTTLVRVRVATRDCQLMFLRKGCTIGGDWYSTQRSRKRNTMRRCYKCQQISSHLAGQCVNEWKCVKCSGDHRSSECNSNVVLCANCGGPHAANSTKCQHWLQQNQLGRKRSGGDVNEKLVTKLNDMKDTLERLIDSALVKIQSIATDTSELKEMVLSLSCNPAHLNISSVPGSLIKLDPDAPSTPPVADELSAETIEPDSSQTYTAPSDVQTTVDVRDSSHENLENDILPGSSDDVLVSSRSPASAAVATFENVDNFMEIDQCVQSRNMNDINSVDMEHADRKQVNHAELSSGMKMDATKLDENSVVPSNFENENDVDDDDENDPTYSDFYRRFQEQQEHDLLARQSEFKPYNGEVMYRYAGGRICKIIHVHGMDGSYSNIKPCAKTMKSLKNVKTAHITCCPFHHLASDIRDSVDKSDALASLSRWRTKDLRVYSEQWHRPFQKALQRQLMAD